MLIINRPLKFPLRILACAIFGVMLVFILFQWSKHKTIVSNNFIRILPPHVVSDAKFMDLRMNSYYLAGLDASTIYLCNRTAPSFVLKTNYSLSDTSHVILQFDEATSIYAEAVETIIDSPNVYSFDGASSVIEHGNISNYKLTSEKGTYPSFNTGIALSNYSNVLRTYDTILKQNILIKSASGRPDIHVSGLLKKQIDGIFCTDGMLAYQNKSNRLFYTYFYRNKFLCMDTNLNLLYEGKTIDTVSKAQITVSYIASQKKYTFSSPPLVVSKSCCVDGSYLYVYSKLRADNEEQHPEYGYSAIDVYELLNGRYLYSFFIPNDDRTPMNNFKIRGQHLVAMYDHTIMTFLIHAPGSN